MKCLPLVDGDEETSELLRGGGGGGGGMVGACSLGIVCERLGLKGDGTAYFDAELTFLSANCR